MNSEQAPGHAAVSRGELVRIALHEWLAARAKTRVTVVVEKPEPRAEQAMTVVVEQHAPRTEPMTVVVEKPEPRAERSKPRR